jgi:CheY-like chemotaxis protein
MVELVGDGDDVHVTAVRTAEEAAAAIDSEEFDCMVVDLVLPGDDGIQLMEKVRAKAGTRELPVIVYTGKDLTPEDDEALKKYAQSVILKSAVHSPERLLSETALFLHRVESQLPERSKAVLEASRHSDASVAGRRVLVVDDDVRNIFAMTSVLEASGLDVSYAENGQAGMEALAGDPAIDLILMEGAMPGMTVTRPRDDPRQPGVPRHSIVASRRRRLGRPQQMPEAGASDYLPKPSTPKNPDLIRWDGAVRALR